MVLIEVGVIDIFFDKFINGELYMIFWIVVLEWYVIVLIFGIGFWFNVLVFWFDFLDWNFILKLNCVNWLVYFIFVVFNFVVWR